VVLGVSIAVATVVVLIGTSGLAAAGVAALAGLSAGGILLFVTSPRHRIPKRFCAGPLVFVCGLLFIGSLVLAFQSIRNDLTALEGFTAILRQPHIIGTLLLVGGVATTLGGIPVTGRDAIRFSQYTSTVSFGLVALCLPLLAFAGLATLEVVGQALDLDTIVATVVDVLLGRTGSGPIDYIGLVLTWTLTLVSVTFCRIGLKHLPIAELAPSSRRERFQTQLNRVQSTLNKLRLLIFVALFVIVLVEFFRMTSALAFTDGYLRVLSIIGTASTLRGVLFCGILFGVVGFGIGYVTKRLAQLDPHRTILRLIPFVSGLILVTVALQFDTEIVTVATSGPLAASRPLVESLLLQYRPATIVVAVLVIAGATPIVLYFGVIVVDATLLPEYADGAALASTGLFVAALGSLLTGGHPFIGFVGIASSFIVWDLSTNAISLGQELGRHTPTRHAELVHLSGSLLIAALGIIVAMAGLFLAGAVPTPPENIAPVAAVISIIGLFALIVGLRSR
jgi:hypothetical protein